MRVIHNGYALTAYGKGRVSITDREGREVFKADDTPFDSEDAARQFLKDFLKGGCKDGRV